MVMKAGNLLTKPARSCLNGAKPAKGFKVGEVTRIGTAVLGPGHVPAVLTL